MDSHSDYPVEVVSKVPRIGLDLDVDVERVKRLEPDLVFTSLTVTGHEKIIEALTARLPLLVIEPKSLEDVFADEELCPMGPIYRAMYTNTEASVQVAVPPHLMERRGFIYQQHLQLPIDL